MEITSGQSIDDGRELSAQSQSRIQIAVNAIAPLPLPFDFALLCFLLHKS